MPEPEVAPAPGAEVSAAGGVVVRNAAAGPEIALVHRPKYDDWSLPKGKLEPGESFEAGALREVLEETGIRCELVAELSPSRYTDAKGRRKLVRWWLMAPRVDAGFDPNEEIDERRWCSASEAGQLLTYPGDASLVSEALEAY